MKIRIDNAELIDPKAGTQIRGDVAIAAGKILAIGSGNIPSDFRPNQRIDAQGLCLCPGLIDAAVHLDKASMMETELQAAVAGGVTALACLPDTKPILDEPGLVEMLKFRAQQLQLAHVYPLGALTKALASETLTEMATLVQAGCVGLAQTNPITDTRILKRALEYAATYGYTVWLNPCDPWLGQGVVASGALATRLGLQGIPVAAETIAMQTLFALLRDVGARVHLCRISSAEGVALVRQAKAQGLAISADVAIHALHLTEERIANYDSRARLLPPLRSAADRDALRQGLKDGTLDMLVSDHTPVKKDHKILPFAESAPGASGVELLLSLCCLWAQESDIPLPQALATVTSKPAQILAGQGANAMQTALTTLATLSPGSAADLCLFAPDAQWHLDENNLRSNGKHSPFAYPVFGRALPAQVRATWVGGRMVYHDPTLAVQACSQ